MDNLIRLVREWGREKGCTNPQTQYIKMTEEVGEIAHELSRNRLKSHELTDAIGDTLVTIIILADILDIDLYQALDIAYSEIKQRTGKTINGGFVKDED